VSDSVAPAAATSPSWSWYGGLLAGLLPLLLLGFGYSALADRTVFVLWALTAAIAWTLTLRQGIELGWDGRRLTGALLLLLALCFAGFAGLEARHRETLDLGFRAVLPGLYHPAATAPRTAAAVAAALGLAGTAALALSLRRRTSE
jgi:hypothetical protein